MAGNFPKIAVCDFSLDGCLKYLSSSKAAKEWRVGELDLINRYAEKLLPEILPEYRKTKTDFVKVEGLGGEAVVIRGFDLICQRETIFKIAFPDANLTGVRTVYQGQNPLKTKVEHFNIVRERYIRGGAQIAGALADIINRKYGFIAHIRTACDFPVYIEMEFLDGYYPLSYYKEKDFRQRFEFFYRLLVLVSLIHSYQIIHRDFKPSNVLVVPTDEGDFPAILDWTFAKQMNVTNERGELVGLTQSSNMNFHIHSPCFSSPRLIEGGGEDADYQDDIFSLGRIMYCLFSNTRPNSVKEFITRTSPVNLGSEVLPATKLPVDAIEIYQKATHVDEAQRYKTVSEFIVDLEHFADTINIDYPRVNVPELIENNDGFDAFAGTHHENVPKSEDGELKYQTSQEKKTTVLIDLNTINDETARQMVKNIIEISVMTNKHNVVILDEKDIKK